MCEECYGIYEGCPKCSHDTIEETVCPECAGEGRFYFSGDDFELTREQYDASDDSAKYVIECDNCKGEGYITNVRHERR